MHLIEVDGRSPTPEQLAAAALESYGHFTTMQVRSHRTRGLALHRARLTGAHRELFSTELDADMVLGHIRHALGTGAGDATVRVLVRQPDDRPSVMIHVRPAGEMRGAFQGVVQPWRLRSVPYQRPVAHVKHLSDFGQGYYQRLAWREGFDEALLTGADGVISEGSVTNVGFFEGSQVIWPDAPMLAGITMQILQARIGDFGLTWRLAPVGLADLGSFDGVFVTNARGLASVAEIDGVALPVDEKRMAKLADAYASAPWDQI